MHVVICVWYIYYNINIHIHWNFISDAHQTFNLFDKKGTGQVSTKELEKVFKSLALQVDDEKLKEWSDELDDEG